MRSLFWKIFLSFWLAQALFLVLAILVTVALRQRESATWETLQSKVLAEAVQAYERGGEEEAHRYLSDLEASQRIRAYLFNAAGEEVTGARPPEWMKNIALGRMRPSSGLGRWFTRGRMLRQSTISPSGQKYTVVIPLPPGSGVFFGPRGVPNLGLLIAVVSSGLVCFLLARYLAGPVTRLRAATQKLASGDLTARAGSGTGGRRGDEIAQLVKDFDNMAERLEGLVKAQSRLLNDISHELRSPLARLNVALALARQRAGPEAQSVLDRIDLEGTRLNELIGRLLTVARLEGGSDGIRASAVELGALVAEIAKDADFEAQARSCRVHIDLQDKCEVTGDASLLRSAIENIVRNGIRYTREGSTVSIQLSHEGSDAEAILQVTDSGPGVPAEALEKVFEPFYRIDDSRVRETGGVGLGLAITQRVARLHGGSVRAANRPEGGLLVEMRLPLARNAPAEAVESSHL